MPRVIALFVYNRPWHTRQTVESLKRNYLAEQSTLHIFSDGPKRGTDPKVEEVREYIKTINGFKQVKITASPTNGGLARSIIRGVSEILRFEDSLIVLEDDMITSPYFLTYMNEALDMYQHDEEVASIHAYVCPVGQQLPETFFLRGADCWGWGTWRRAWKLFEPDGRLLLNEIQQQGLEYEFDYFGSYPYTRMLRQQIKGKNDSWAIRWYATAFLKNKLTLYPGISLIRNIGNDSSGTHSWDSDRFDHVSLANAIKLEKLTLVENQSAKVAISTYLKSTNPSVLRKMYHKFKFLLQRK